MRVNLNAGIIPDPCVGLAVIEGSKILQAAGICCIMYPTILTYDNNTAAKLRSVVA
jgi:hypothetical protein